MRTVEGLDLGQSQDFTALAIIESDDAAKPTCFVRHLQRWPLRTPYTQIIEDLTEMFENTSLREASLVVDHTGVGRGVVDTLRAIARFKQLTAITIHGGDSVTREGFNWRVPKRDLVACVQVLLEQGRLRVAPALREAKILEAELLNFKVKINPETAHDSYLFWRENEHDDLVLATCLAAFLVTQPKYDPPRSASFSTFNMRGHIQRAEENRRRFRIMQLQSEGLICD